MTINFTHVPVMPAQVIDGLNIRPDGIYIDGTLGGGGHAALLKERLNDRGRLIGIDQDIDAINAVKSRLNIEMVHGNFHDLPQILLEKNIAKIDGILLDLGVSSYQLDTPERGFSYRLPSRLDMRMNRSASLSAYEIVNTYPQEELADIFFNFGEERYGRRIARAIEKRRLTAPIETTLELADLIEKSVPRQKFNNGPHPAMRSFMALRIAVNNELHPLDKVLTKIIGCLNPGGRICVISFHSLEDRIVKQCFNRLQSPCRCPREIPYCVCNETPVLNVITKKPILPTPEELAQNSRAASAKLRIGEKLNEKPEPDTKSPKKP